MLMDERIKMTDNGFAKAQSIFAELVADRTERLDGARPAYETMAIIYITFIDHFGVEKATDIAFHLSDWNSDAAFIVALHLFPERFTKEEIESGVEKFIIHAPNHVAEAAKLLGHPVGNIFEEDEDE